MLPPHLTDCSVGFHEFYDIWRNHEGVRLWLDENGWKIFHLEVEGVVYHLSIFMETRWVLLFRMKKTPWENGQNFSLEVEERVMSHEFGRTF